MIIPTFVPSTIENIDSAVLEWVDKELNIFTNTNEGYKKVNVIFSIRENSFINYSKDSVDEKNTLKYPIISIIRKNFKKPTKKELAMQGSRFTRNSTSLMIPVHRELNQDKTSQRANADSKRYAGTLNSKKSKTKRPVYITYNIPVPTAVSVNYEISMISNFQLQMNDILSPFLKYTNNINGFKVERNGHVYELFMSEDIQSSSPDDVSEEERKFEYSFELIAKGYIHDGDFNDKTPTVYKQENFPEIVFKSEIIESGTL